MEVNVPALAHGRRVLAFGTWRSGLHRCAALAAFGCLALGFDAAAYTVEPNLLLLRPAGAESSTFLRLQNKQGRPVAVEITVNEHAKDLDGASLHGKPADDQFLVFPSQLILLPGDEAAVQVRWVGDAALDRERAFTLTTREVAIPTDAPLPEPTRGLRLSLTLLLNYEVRLYVRPNGARARLVLESVSDARAPPDVPAGRMLELVLANEGTAQQALGGLKLTLRPADPQGAPVAGPSVTLPVSGLAGARSPLLAGERRRLLLPRPEGFPAGRVHVQFAQ